jgi:hypothetical protein
LVGVGGFRHSCFAILASFTIIVKKRQIGFANQPITMPMANQSTLDHSLMGIFCLLQRRVVCPEMLAHLGWHFVAQQSS